MPKLSHMDSQIRFGVESALLTLDYAGFLENVQGSYLFLLLDSPVLPLFSRVDFPTISEASISPFLPCPLITRSLYPTFTEVLQRP